MLHKSPSPFRGFLYYLRCKAFGLPFLVNLEITKKCNARCLFCSCWRADSDSELDDYGPVIKKFRPVVASVSGGEPLMRKDYARLLKGIRPYCHYLIIITNGAMLDRESARVLVESGVNQICVSCDFLGARHDEMRGVPGLYDYLSKTIPELTKEGFRITLNTVIMESNLDDIIPIAHKAKEWGAAVSFSAFCALKRGNGEEMVAKDRQSHLSGVVEEIIRLKRKLGNIKNSDYYLKAIPAYFRDGRMPGCKAGYCWLQVTPDGYIQQCSEMPRVCHYDEFSRKKISLPACEKCWYTCRGEAEAPKLEPRRLMEFIRA